ncbi:hypothetical protein ABG067_002000 [Albugo candida]
MVMCACYGASRTGIVTADKGDVVCSKMTSSSQKMHAFVKEDMRLSAKVNDHQESREQEKTKGYRDCEESTCISAFKAEFEKLRAEKQAYMKQLDSLSDLVFQAELKQKKHQSTLLELAYEQLRTRRLELEPYHALTIDYEEKNVHLRNGMRLQSFRIGGPKLSILEEDQQATGMGRLQATFEDREAQTIPLECQLNAHCVSSASQITNITTQL